MGLEYSDEILARVRAALIEYHAATASNGRKRSWSNIANDLHFSFLEPPPIDEAADADEGRVIDIDKPVAESLRRFAAGVQTPSKERLDAICAFLKEKGYLSDDDLRPTEPGTPLIRALRAFFGITDKVELTSGYFYIRGVFAASSKRESQAQQYSILAIRDVGDNVTIAEDLVYSLPTQPSSMRPVILDRHIKKTGGARQRFNGWLLQAKGQVCLFLRDSLTESASIYTVIRHKAAAGTAPAVFDLIKSQDFGAIPWGYEEQGLRLMRGRSPEDMRVLRLRENIWAYAPHGGSHGA